MAVPLKGKVLLDTNVFIDYLRSGRHAAWVAGQVDGVVRMLSAVVLMELRMGADTSRRQRAVDRLKAAFPPGRIISPGPELFDRAGRLFSRLHRQGGAPADRLGAMNDLLIALTARQIGATVVTANTEDFRLIESHVTGLSWVVPS